MKPRVVASIEARMASTRLPGKVLAAIAGHPALSWMIERLRAATTLDAIVLATTTAEGDDALAAWARAQSIACHRGSEDDVLARVVEAHREQGTDVIVELCGDCPLIDPRLVDRAVAEFLKGGNDMVTTARGSGYPQGTEVQVFRFADLAEIAATVGDPLVREHVSLAFLEHPARYRIKVLRAPAGERGAAYRLQLDYPEDLAFLNALRARLDGTRFGIAEIVAALDADPALAAINAHCQERRPR